MVNCYERIVFLLTTGLSVSRDSKRYIMPEGLQVTGWGKERWMAVMAEEGKQRLKVYVVA